MIKLSRWEKQILLVSLITPKTWARQIKKRNEMLLDAVGDDDEEWVDYNNNIGCPHCQEVKKRLGIIACRACRWQAYRHFYSSEPCLAVRFGNTLYRDDDSHTSLASHLYYWVDSERIEGIPAPGDIKFLEAHILWAERILDGTYVRYAEENGIEKPKKRKGVWNKEVKR